MKLKSSTVHLTCWDAEMKLKCARAAKCHLVATVLASTVLEGHINGFGELLNFLILYAILHVYVYFLGSKSMVSIKF